MNRAVSNGAEKSQVGHGTEQCLMWDRAVSYSHMAQSIIMWEKAVSQSVSYGTEKSNVGQSSLMWEKEV